MSTPKAQPQKRFKSFTEGLFTALLAALIIRQFIIQAYTIPTSSMENTLLVGDFLLVNKFNYGMRTPDWIGIPYTKIGFSIPWYRFPALHDPKPYDVIIFHYPLDKSMDYIKRCIAVGGQTVEIIDKVVYVDGKPFPVPPQAKFIDPRIFKRNEGRYYFRTFRNLGSRDNYGPITIPPGKYWAMGDNRDNSSDSRVWGFVDHDEIIGQALIIYFSWDHNRPWSQFFRKIRFGRIGNVIR
ncbi:MAG TPA: signal peptidase I [Caldithrix abyssi]|uniref:Signal peptidase I n=1 Tax=Caldithrix abyssi TaxID=187145 RepID=A0A7V5PRT6_CALAY|nr:signal peptidase I [Caldithrix abyssi]